MEHEKKCDYCGKTYIANRRDSRFCSGLCRNRHNNENFKRASTTNREQSTGRLDEIMDGITEIKSILSTLSSQHERILSVDDVCTELGISRQTVERMVADGSIKLHRFGVSSGTGRSRKPFVLFSELVSTLKIG